MTEIVRRREDNEKSEICPHSTGSGQGNGEMGEWGNGRMGIIDF
jgi:hypothetical protein